jgi:hypothetical protein
MLALSATPFISTNISSRYIGRDVAATAESGLQVQQGDWPVEFRAALRSEGECGAFLSPASLSSLFRSVSEHN